jgi:site-specific recombinase XerD
MYGHDLRHGFASVLAGLGESLPIIGKTLGHRQAATTQRYAHLADDPVRNAVERAGAALMGMAEKRKAELVELSKLQA